MKKILSSLIMFSMIFSLVGTVSFDLGKKEALALSPAEVDLNSAGDYAVLAKTAITTTGTSSVVGDVGISPALSTDTEGFGLVLDVGGTFATSSLISGSLYAADYTEPTPSTLSTAVSDMEEAYTDANSRATTVLNAGGGNLAGLNLVAGVYTFDGSGDVSISDDVTLTGSEDDVWIFQIPGTLDISEGKEIVLNGGAKSSNIFWAVEGTTTLEANSVFMGNILAGPGASTIAMQDGATLNGRALGQTDVTLIANIISEQVVTSEPSSTAKVTIVKYLDGEVATAESANETAFSMHATFPGGEGNYALEINGYNNENPYYATTSDMPIGSDYSTYENIGDVVGTSCDTTPYMLNGYSTGNTLEEAIAGTQSTTTPAFTNLTSDKFVIVWNHDCINVEPPMCEVGENSTIYYSDVNTQVGENDSVLVATPVNPAWTAVIDGANWIWNQDPVANTTDEVITLTKTFSIVGTPADSELMIAADNSYEVILNGEILGADTLKTNFSLVTQDTYIIASSMLNTGANTMEFRVLNIGTGSGSNPGGLLYKLTVNENECVPPPPVDVCPNIEGNQNEIPEGQEKVDGQCVDIVNQCEAGMVSGWNVDYYNYMATDTGMNLPFENWYQKSLYGNPLSANNTFTTTPDAWTGWSYGADKYKFSQVESDLMFGAENFFPFNTGEVGEAFQNESLSVQNIGIDNNGSYTFVTTPGGKDYHFGLHATGYVTAPTAGDYAYTQISDDDLWVYVDGVLVLDNSGVHGVPGDGALTSGTIPLSLGVNKVELFFAERHAVQSALNFQFTDPLVVRTTLDCPPPEEEGENTIHTTVVKMADLAPDFAGVIADPTKWFFYNDENDTINNSLGSFVTGPMTAPIGTGSAEMTVAGTERKNIATYQFKNVKLSDITDLSFATYSQLAGDGALGLAERAPYLHFNVDFNNSDTWQKRLVYVPAVNGIVTAENWQTWNTTGTALWTWSGYAGAGNMWPDGNTSEYRTWDAIVLAFPNAETRSTDSWFGFRVGEPYADGFTGNVDKVVMGIQSGLDNHVETYDFEPTAVIPTPVIPEDSSDNNNRSSSGSSRRNFNSGGTGEVLGAATEICNLNIDTYMRVGYENNADQVHTLKNFLNWYMGAGLNVDGLYDFETANAVSAFQMKHADKILTPWGLTRGTGIFYKTTLVEAKNKMCPEVILPIPTNLINWSQNQNQVPSKI